MRPPRSSARPGADPGPGTRRGDRRAGVGRELLEAEVESFEEGARRMAAGGWRRALIGIAVGCAAGIAAALAMDDDGRGAR